MTRAERMSVPSSVFRRRAVVLLLVLATVIFAGYLIYHLDGSGPAKWYQPRCIWYETTHLYCPGCGATRLFHDLLHGNLSAAFAHNPLLFIAVPPLFYVIVSRTGKWLTGTGLPEVRLSKYAIYLIFFVITLYWIVRNIPQHPFSLLAP